MGSYCKEVDVRNFFSPFLDYDDIDRATIDLYIEAVEDYVEAVWFNDGAPAAAKARLPCLLLIASKIVANPELAKKYNTLKRESLGDYSYELASPREGASPHEISISWERMALDMLRARTTLKKFYVELAD